MKIRFRHPTVDDAQLMLDWRSSPRINDKMFSDMKDVTLAQQQKWLEACAQRDDYVHFIIECDDEPAGFLSYTDIDRVNGRCSSGSYFGSDEAARKYAGYMHAYFMDYLFYVLKMNKMVIQITDVNPRVIKIQRVLGLREVGVLREQFIKHGVRHDVYLFEILKSDWEKKRWNTISIAESLAAFGITYSN